MNEPAARTYDQWAAEHQVWTDILHFTRGFRSGPRGLHSIGLGAGESLDVLVVGSPGSDGRAVPVFLNGAVPSRDVKNGPFFSGGRVGPQVAPGHVAISDPTVDRDAGVPLAWYAGNEFANVPAAVLGVLDVLGAAWNQELVLVGGSGGGFASLYYAGRTSATASAFLWNPQTDILAYNRVFVDSYLQSAFPSTFRADVQSRDWKTDYARSCAEAGIHHSVLNDVHVPSALNRLLLVQNRPDWHLATHTAPYIERHGFRPMGTGSYLLDPEHVVQVAEWGPGHAPLPQELVVENLRGFLDGRTTALDLGRSLATGPQCQPNTLDKAPMDLRPVRDIVTTAITASPIGADGKLRVTTSGLPLGYGGLRFGVTRQDGDSRRQLAWFSEGPDLSVPPHEVDGAATTTLVVRDGFNHHLAGIPLEIVPEFPRTSVEDSPPGGRSGTDRTHADGTDTANVDTRTVSNDASCVGPVFIYGSCVTRDAFALPGAPPVAEYVARSPLISAMAPALERYPGDADLSAVESAFQRRMVQWDWDKALPHLLREASYDVLVLDFIDERIPLVSTDAGIVAFSVEAQRTGLGMPPSARIDSSSDGYEELWKAAADRFLSHIDPTRLVLNRVFWATEDENGADLTKKFPVHVSNASLTWMYDYVRSVTDCRVVDYPESVVVAKSEHQWGLSPFHYVEGFYKHFMHELGRIHHEL